MTVRHHAQNFRMHAGDDLRVIVTVRDQSGELVDISDAQDIRWAVAPHVSADPVIEKSLADGITINSPTSFTFDLTSAETGALSRGRYYHEAEAVTDQGLTYTALSGSLFIDPVLLD